MPNKKSNGNGRRSPPKHGQFKKGRSGNPAGRPKGSKNLATLIAESAYDQITVTSKDGKTKKLSRIQMTILQLSNMSAKGDLKAINSYVALVDDMEQRAERRPMEIQLAAEDLAVLHAIHDRMQRCLPPPPQGGSNEAAPR